MRDRGFVEGKGCRETFIHGEGVQRSFVVDEGQKWGVQKSFLPTGLFLLES